MILIIKMMDHVTSSKMVATYDAKYLTPTMDRITDFQRSGVLLKAPEALHYARR